MPPRPHLLFLSQALPHPPQSGVRARTFNILKQLRKEFDITLVAFSRSAHQANADERQISRRALQAIVWRVSTPIPIPSEESRTRRAWNHLRSVISRRPYTYYEYASKDFQVQLQHAIGQRAPDLIHLDSLDLHRWLADLPPVPKFCTHHDIDSELLRRRADRVSSSLVGSYIRHQAGLVERTEREFCPQFTANVMMSELDARKLEGIAPGSRTMVVPNGVDTDYFMPATSLPVPGRVTFVGSPSFPNRDAVQYLLRDVWPIIRAADGSANLQVIGGFPEADSARFRSHAGVTHMGRVADVRRHVAEACCCVVPIRVGGGTRLKILDAWAMGKAVISTSIGCEGLNAIDAHNILIRDTPQQFADAVCQVLSNSGLRSHLGANGRQTVEQAYSWDAIGRDLRAHYWEQLRLYA